MPAEPLTPRSTAKYRSHQAKNAWLGFFAAAKQALSPEAQCGLSTPSRDCCHAQIPAEASFDAAVAPCLPARHVAQCWTTNPWSNAPDRVTGTTANP